MHICGLLWQGNKIFWVSCKIQCRSKKRPKKREGCLHYRPTNDKKSLSHILCERVNTELFQSFPRILVVVSINLIFVIVSNHLSLKCIWVMYWPEHELMCMHEPKQLSFFRQHQQQMSTVQKFRPTRGSILFPILLVINSLCGKQSAYTSLNLNTMHRAKACVRLLGPLW